MVSSSRSLPFLLTRALVLRDIPDATDIEAAAAAAKVLASIDSMPDFTRSLSFGGSASRPALIALSLAENWREFGAAPAGWRRLSVYYGATQSVGRGRVQAVPGFADPMVTYRLTRQDLAMLRSGLARLMHITLAAGATAVYPACRGAPLVTGPLDAARAAPTMTRSRSSCTR